LGKSLLFPAQNRNDAARAATLSKILVAREALQGLYSVSCSTLKKLWAEEKHKGMFGRTQPLKRVHLAQQ